MTDCASALAWRFDDWGEESRGWRYWEIRYTGFGAELCLARPAGDCADGTRLILSECNMDHKTQQ